jgi:hypothetical protein
MARIGCASVPSWRGADHRPARRGPARPRAPRVAGARELDEGDRAIERFVGSDGERLLRRALLDQVVVGHDDGVAGQRNVRAKPAVAFRK